LAHLVRDVVSDAISNRISDPRVSRFTSVTSVRISPDMRVADVHVSVMGDEQNGLTTMKGLDSARGLIQSRLARQIRMRTCPSVRFHLDLGIKKAIETYQSLSDIAHEKSRPDDSAASDALDNEAPAQHHSNPEVGE
jgi:ribosome-binding factor A